MERYLSILEVSQKQAYIFSSNKLHDNIRRSALIAWITSPKYFEEVTDDKNLFDGEKNLVYSGGGHIVLVFDSYEKAVAFNRMVTTAIRKSYEGIEVFVSVRKYETEGKDGMPLTATKNLSHLKESLEWKKSIRRASFHQGSFGLATLSADTRNVTSDAASIKMTKDALELDHWIMPGEYKPAYEFGNLGGTVGDNNYIAVIHLDGNGMGSRINDFYEKNEGKDWEEFRKSVLEYSDAIDADYKKAFKEMMQQVADKLDEPDGTLKKELDHIRRNYEYVIIDCPPSLNILTINALCAGDSVLVPLQCEYYALEGLAQLIQTVDLITQRLNSDLKIEGIVFTMYDGRTNLAAQVVENVEQNTDKKIYKCIIPRNVRLAEAPSYGMPITEYDPKSAGAKAYDQLAKKVISYRR